MIHRPGEQWAKVTRLDHKRLVIMFCWMRWVLHEVPISELVSTLARDRSHALTLTRPRVTTDALRTTEPDLTVRWSNQELRRIARNAVQVLDVRHGVELTWARAQLSAPQTNEGEK